MLSVEEADVVRKNIVDGYLQGDSFLLKVQDLKQSISHLLHKPSAPVVVKNAPIRLCSSWLPLNKEVQVEVVDYLPSSATPSDLFGLTIIQVQNKAFDEKYEVLREKLNNYANLQPFENDNVLAVRNILYLIDFHCSPVPDRLRRRLQGGSEAPPSLPSHLSHEDLPSRPRHHCHVRQNDGLPAPEGLPVSSDKGLIVWPRRIDVEPSRNPILRQGPRSRQTVEPD